MTGKLLAGFILALTLAGSSSAAPVTWAFEGNVVDVDSQSAAILATLTSLGVTPGSSFSGSFVFESSTEDTNPDDPWAGYYGGAISFMEITIGSYHQEVSDTDYTIMGVSPYQPEDDIPGSLFANALGPAGGGLSDNAQINLGLHELTPGQIGSDALPLFPPGPAPYEDLEFHVFGPDWFIEGDLTQIGVVPEPSPFVFLVPLALVATHFRRRSQT